jgi:hypothetical protein
LKYVLESYTGLQGLEKIYEEWCTLAASSARHFLHLPQWYLAHLRSNVAVADQVVFVVVRDEEHKIVAICPFEKCHIRILGLWIPIGQICYPNEMGVNDLFILNDCRDIYTLIERSIRQILGNVLFVRFQCVLEGSAVSQWPGANIHWSHHSYYLDVSDGFDNFFSKYKSKFRNDLIKKEKKIQAKSSLEVSVVSSPELMDEAFAKFLDVEDSGWKGRSGTSIKKQPEKLRYYTLLKEELTARGFFRVNILSLGGKTIAGQCGIQVGDCLYLLKIGFDEDYSKFSPGALNLYKLLKRASNEMLFKKLSFVTGVSWIERWHPSQRRVGVKYISNRAWWSRLIVVVLCKLKKRENIKGLM